MLESLLKRIFAREDAVARRVPPPEVRSARRRGSQLESCLRACIEHSCVLVMY